MAKIISDRPSSWPGELWREALPVGNGLTGALITCGAGTDHIWLNHHSRWTGERETLPDVSSVFPEQRRLVMEGRYPEAKWLLSVALTEKGYKGSRAVPSKPVYLRIEYDQKKPFYGYTRGIDTQTGTAYCSFTTGGKRQEREAYVSDSDVFIYRFSSEAPVDIKLYRISSDEVKTAFTGSFTARSDYEDFTALTGVTSLVIACSFTAEPDTSVKQPARRTSAASLSLGESGLSNEALLDNAYKNGADGALVNRLWEFGRYLFAAGTCEEGDPFPLYGLWHGTENPQWAQNVANENVEMIYWHACPGDMAHLVRPLIHYYYRQMPDSRENARKLFNCRGIMVSVYSTPQSGLVAPNVPVITNYTGCAGWLSRHFYEYYLYTRDEELLEREILPFMTEAALFYEDYSFEDENGTLVIAPSVSPENTPGNLMPPAGSKPIPHPSPVVKNAVMDIAIIKDLLSSLIELSKTHEMDPGRVQKWRKMLSSLPAYRVNEGGAVKEWSADDLTDNYRHRHLSHIYPLFPGGEVRKGHPLFKNFEKAVDLRELGAQSGWSLAHMAAIYARMGRGNDAFECVNTLTRSCVLNNLFTLHNDWRDMSLTLNANSGAPVQLDALMGIVNAVQEMLMRWDDGRLNLLPALPDALPEGSFENWRVPDAYISCRWDKSGISCSIRAIRDTEFDVIIPDRPDIHIALKQGETARI